MLEIYSKIFENGICGLFVQCPKSSEPWNFKPVICRKDIISVSISLKSGLVIQMLPYLNTVQRKIFLSFQQYYQIWFNTKLESRKHWDADNRQIIIVRKVLQKTYINKVLFSLINPLMSLNYSLFGISNSYNFFKSYFSCTHIKQIITGKNLKTGRYRTRMLFENCSTSMKKSNWTKDSFIKN